MQPSTSLTQANHVPNTQPTWLIKLGGSVLQDAALLKKMCAVMAQLRQSVRLVLVHGGGPAINQELKIHGISWNFLEGQRITTPAMMQVVEMVLCGQVNKQVVRALGALQVPAIGLSGADLNLVLCTPARAELGQVGKIQQVNGLALTQLLQQNWLPVLASVGVGHDGQAFNINADVLASELANTLQVERLIFLTDQDGILNAQGNLLPDLSKQNLADLIQTKVVLGGMLAKTQTIIQALENKIKSVHILNAQNAEHLCEQVKAPQPWLGSTCTLVKEV